jgi:hypothetical protein
LNVGKSDPAFSRYLTTLERVLHDEYSLQIIDLPTWASPPTDELITIIKRTTDASDSEWDVTLPDGPALRLMFDVIKPYMSGKKPIPLLLGQRKGV